MKMSLNEAIIGNLYKIRTPTNKYYLDDKIVMYVTKAYTQIDQNDFCRKWLPRHEYCNYSLPVFWFYSIDKNVFTFLTSSDAITGFGLIET